jgi:hypothetical protein
MVIVRRGGAMACPRVVEALTIPANVEPVVDCFDRGDNEWRFTNGQTHTGAYE